MYNYEQSVIYSEVNGILNILGENYINSIPKKLLKYIKDNKNKDYNPIYDINKPLAQQNISKRAASFMCMLHYKYWCKTDEEKEQINKILAKNYQKIKEKYSYENLFIDKDKAKEVEKINIEDNNKLRRNDALIEYRESIIKKVIDKIKGIFFKNK